MTTTETAPAALPAAWEPSGVPHDNQTNLLLAAGYQAVEELRSYARQITRPADRGLADGMRELADTIQLRVEHATGWTWLALEGDEDTLLEADGQFSDETAR